MSVRVLKEQLARLKREIYPDGMPPCSECDEVRDPGIFAPMEVNPPYGPPMFDWTKATADELELVLMALDQTPVREDCSCGACGREWMEETYHLKGEPSDELLAILERIEIPT